MAAVGQNVLTLADWANRQDNDGVAAIIELLGELNEITEDMLWMEANGATGHRTTVRTGIPTPTWRLLNYGVSQAKSTTAQVTDGIGMLETYSKVDKALADLNGNTAAFRLSEDVAFLEGMMQEMTDTIFYGNSAADPEKFTGLAPRYNDLSANSGVQVIDAAGVGADNTSVWLVGWGANSVHGIFPKGQISGLQSRDLGEDTVQDANGNEYQAYRTHYKWDAGLTVRDWRYIVRIANIDVSNLTKDATGSSADLVDNLTDAVERIRSLNGVRPAFYCNRTVRSFLRRQIKNSNNVHIGMSEVAGKRVMDFDGVPVRLCESLLNTEAPVA